MGWGTSTQSGGGDGVDVTVSNSTGLSYISNTWRINVADSKLQFEELIDGVWISKGYFKDSIHSAGGFFDKANLVHDDPLGHPPKPSDFLVEENGTPPIILSNILDSQSNSQILISTITNISSYKGLFSTDRSYLANDIVNNGDVYYKAKLDKSPSSFNVAEWDVVGMNFNSSTNYVDQDLLYYNGSWWSSDGNSSSAAWSEVNRTKLGDNFSNGAIQILHYVANGVNWNDNTYNAWTNDGTYRNILNQHKASRLITTAIVDLDATQLVIKQGEVIKIGLLTENLSLTIEDGVTIFSVFDGNEYIGEKTVLVTLNNNDNLTLATHNDNVKFTLGSDDVWTYYNYRDGTGESFNDL